MKITHYYQVDKKEIDRALKQQIGIRMKMQIKKDKKKYDSERDKLQGTPRSDNDDGDD